MSRAGNGHLCRETLFAPAGGTDDSEGYKKVKKMSIVLYGTIELHSHGVSFESHICGHTINVMVY